MATTKRMLLLIVALLVTPVGVFADGLGATVWNLSGLSSGGSISWDGTSAGALTGSGIVSDRVDGSGTPMNAGKIGDLTITSGSLAFSTGAGSYNGTLGSTWSWGVGTGANLTLTGCIAAISTCGILLEDSFTNITITQIPGPDPVHYDILVGGIQGHINPFVANYFGLANDTGFAAASFHFQILSAAAPGNALTDVTGANNAGVGGVINANVVPEPSSRLLLATGIVGLLLWRGRKTPVVC